MLFQSRNHNLEHGFALTGALAMVAAHPAIVPLVNNSATLTTMGFAFPGLFQRKVQL